MKSIFSKKENAEVMVEASLILAIAVICIFSLFYVGIIMYHQTTITAVANQTAANVAQVYGNQYKDPVTGYVDVSNLDKEGIVNKMKSQDYANNISKVAEWFSKYRIAKTQVLKAKNPTVDVRIENKKGTLLRAQVVVDVSASYDNPFVKFFNIKNSTLTYKAEGRADCYELMDYVNIIEAADKIDVTENFLVTFHNKDDSVYKVVEVMHDMSIEDTSKLSSAEKTRFPANPTLKGERFYRWKTATGETFTKKTIVTGNMDVYAEYDCRVIFTKFDNKTQYTMKYAHRNQPFKNGGSALPAGPNTNGRDKFYCWWYNNAVFNANTVVPDADTITVTTVKYYWVEFNANGGSVGENVRFVAPGSAVGTLPNPSRTNYDFLGWFTATEGGNKYSSGNKINSNVILYAHWLRRCLVTFNANGGSVGESGRYVSKGDAVGKLPTPSRAYYNFLGWFTAPSGGQQYGSGSKINDDITLYAHWECTHPGGYRSNWYTVQDDCHWIITKRDCNLCGKKGVDERKDPSDHDWGYCNRVHNVGYKLSFHTSADSYNVTTKGRHIICVKCHASQGRWSFWCTQHSRYGKSTVADYYWTWAGAGEVPCPY
ncbi:MAG: InlB B-repeat-containing protein [Clostridiales bacterium]|nr:InlB B-repeat-containing protein [Clostridiales bacterium]